METDQMHCSVVPHVKRVDFAACTEIHKGDFGIWHHFQICLTQMWRSSPFPLAGPQGDWRGSRWAASVCSWYAIWRTGSSSSSSTWISAKKGNVLVLWFPRLFWFSCLFGCVNAAETYVSDRIQQGWTKKTGLQCSPQGIPMDCCSPWHLWSRGCLPENRAAPQEASTEGISLWFESNEDTWVVWGHQARPDQTTKHSQ